MKAALFILVFVFISLHVLGQDTSDNNKPLFYDTDVDFMFRCTEDYPLIPWSRFKGDTVAFLKTNFTAGAVPGCFGFTNRTIQALVDTMRKELPIKTVLIKMKEFGIPGIMSIFFFCHTPEKIKQAVKNRKETPRVELCIHIKTLRKREEIIKKYMAVEKLLEWDDKYLKVLGGITYEYAIFFQGISYK